MDENIPCMTKPDSFHESMLRCSQVSEIFYQQQLEWHDFSKKVYALQAPIIRSLVGMANGESASVKRTFKFEACEAAYEREAPYYA